MSGEAPRVCVLPRCLRQHVTIHLDVALVLVLNSHNARHLHGLVTGTPRGWQGPRRKYGCDGLLANGGCLLEPVDE